MSGGYFDHLDSQLKHEIYGFDSKPRNVFEDMEISKLVWDVLDLIHAFDYYKEGDFGREDYLKAKEEFKKKWFADGAIRQKRIVDEALDNLRNELYETLGLEVPDDVSGKEGSA